jgi:Family of unknown function (DUF5832)
MSVDSKANLYDLPVTPLSKDLDPKPLPISETQEVILKNYIVSIIKGLAPKYGVTEQKLLADINEVAPLQRQKKVPAPLNDSQIEVAKKELVNSDYTKFSFPKQIRMGVDPAIPSQNFCLLSFYPCKEAKADNGRFGSLKIRGSFATETEAEDRSDYLIRNVDSYSTYFIAPCGVEVPISDDMYNYTKTLQEVDIRRKNDKIAKDYIQSKIEEEKREKQEVEDRREALFRESQMALEGKTETDPINQYIEVRVSRSASRRQMEEVEKMRTFCSNNIKATTSRLAMMEADYNGPLEKVATERYLKTLGERGLDVVETMKFW